MILNKNEDGIALIMVLLVLIVVGVLAAALLASSRTHVSTAIHETEMSQAFYAADSGVELLRAYLGNIIYGFYEDDDYNSFNDFEAFEGYYINSDYKGAAGIDDIFMDEENIYVFDNGAEFSVKVSNVKHNKIEFISTGEYSFDGNNNIEKNIEFEISLGDVFNNFNIFRRHDDDEEHYDDAGDGLGGFISLIDFDDVADEGQFVEFAYEIIATAPDYYDDTLIGDGDGEDFFDTDDDPMTFNEEAFCNEEGFEDEDNIEKSGQKTTIDGEIEEKYYLIEGDLEILQDGIIKESLIVVKGSIDQLKNQAEIHNSIIIVQGYVNYVGASAADDWVNPFIAIYGEEERNPFNYLKVAGTGSFEIIPKDFPDDTPLVLSISNWRQQ